jgi:crotonobetaine/carnitine-CoA ligase
MRWRVVPERLRHWARTTPDAPFVKCDSAWLSYSQVEAQSAQVAGGLQALGVGKGDRVSIVLPNRIEFVLAIFGIARLGAVQVPLNTFLRGEFLSYQLNDSKAKVVITDSAGIRELERIVDDLPSLEAVVCVDAAEAGRIIGRGLVVRSFADVAAHAAAVDCPAIEQSDLVAILYTSGTTGMPKGCMMSHGYYMAMTLPWVACGWIHEQDRIFTAFPMFHASGNIMALINALQLGISVCYETGFSARNFMARAAEEGGTVALGVGPMGMAILATPPSDSDRAHKLRLCMWTPIEPKAQAAFEQRFGTRVTGQSYGQTELIVIAMGPLDGPAEKAGSAGRPSELVELRIVDDLGREAPPGQVGEIVVRPRGPELMFQGYWQKPEATVQASRNLWHHTGDFGVIDGDGYLRFIDRKKDALRRRGENISSFELEKAILRHEAIAAVAIHAVPSPLGEDDVKACVVVKPGASVEPEPLFAWFASQLPYYAVPRYVEVMAALPTNAVGRVMKHVLRERGVAGAWDLEQLGFSIGKEQRRG